MDFADLISFCLSSSRGEVSIDIYNVSLYGTPWFFTSFYQKIFELGSIIINLKMMKREL